MVRHGLHALSVNDVDTEFQGVAKSIIKMKHKNAHIFPRPPEATLEP
jgi:hypothetical protein